MSNGLFFSQLGWESKTYVPLKKMQKKKWKAKGLPFWCVQWKGTLQELLHLRVPYLKLKLCRWLTKKIFKPILQVQNQSNLWGSKSSPILESHVGLTKMTYSCLTTSKGIWGYYPRNPNSKQPSQHWSWAVASLLLTVLHS